MTTQLNETIKQLIAKSRIVSFANWQNSHPTEASHSVTKLNVLT